MRRPMVGLVVLALVVAGAFALVAANRTRISGVRSTQAEAGTARDPSSTAASNELAGGKIAGRFDPAATGPCQFACATKLEYDPKDVRAQPGAIDGELTQCPVSGVVFAAGADRPHVQIAGEDYVACCDGCAAKLERDPGRYLKL